MTYCYSVWSRVVVMVCYIVIVPLNSVVLVVCFFVCLCALVLVIYDPLYIIYRSPALERLLHLRLLYITWLKERLVRYWYVLLPMLV